MDAGVKSMLQEMFSSTPSLSAGTHMPTSCSVRIHVHKPRIAVCSALHETQWMLNVWLSFYLFVCWVFFSKNSVVFLFFFQDQPSCQTVGILSGK